MSSLLLRPPTLDSCTSSLRERRRSSVNNLAAVPRLFLPKQEPDPVFDDSDPLDSLTSTVVHSSPCTSPTTATPTVPSLAHLRNPQIDIQREDSLPLGYSLPSSPTTPHSTSRRSSQSELLKDLAEDSDKPERVRWRLASGFFAYFLCGWGDGVTGTVLPYFMKEFHTSYMMSSLLYAGSTTGFMIGTLLVGHIVNRLGTFNAGRNSWRWLPYIPPPFKSLCRRGPPTKFIGFSPSQARHISLLVASLLHSMFFVIMGNGRSFWVLFLGYIVAAFARSILTANLNYYYAKVSPPSIGYAYGQWSFGGVISPLISQILVAKGVPWRHFYLGSLLLSATNIAFLVLTHKPTRNEFLRDREEVLRKYDDIKVDSRLSNYDKLEKSGSGSLRLSMECNEQGQGKGKGKGKTIALAVRQPFMWAAALFAFLYCGCETVTQGQMASFLLGARHANPDTVGYVVSGFWGGITIGRLVWGRYSPRITAMTRKFAILGCMCTALCLQVVICLVDSDTVDSVATAIIGLLFGPMFPACLALANDMLPAELRMVSMALISAFSSVGSSLFPFLTGTISNTQGIHILPYMAISLAAATACLWATFPYQARHGKTTA